MPRLPGKGVCCCALTTWCWAGANLTHHLKHFNKDLPGSTRKIRQISLLPPSLPLAHFPLPPRLLGGSLQRGAAVPLGGAHRQDQPAVRR